MTRALLLVLAAAVLLSPACGDSGGEPAADLDDLAVSPDTTSDVTVGPDAAADSDAPGPSPDAGADVQPDPAPEPLVELVDMFVGTGADIINFGALFPGPRRPSAW